MSEREQELKGQESWKITIMDSNLSNKKRELLEQGNWLKNQTLQSVKAIFKNLNQDERLIVKRFAIPNGTVLYNLKLSTVMPQ